MNKFVLFGAGTIGKMAGLTFGEKNIRYYLDNNEERWGKTFCGIEIISLSEFCKRGLQDLVIICANNYKADEIAKQLECNGITRYCLYDQIKNCNGDEINDVMSGKTDIYKLKYNYMKEKCEILSLKYEYLKEHSDITKLKPSRGFLRKKQLNLANFAAELFKLLPENVNPFMIAGNLLGYIRNRGFIPWDDDMDFGVIREEYETLFDFCASKYKVFYYDGKEEYCKWVDTITRKNADEYILFVYPEHIQISKGKSCIDRLCVDFFAFDFYCGEYNQFIMKVQEIADYMNLNKMNPYEKYVYQKKMIENYLPTCKKSNNIYFGLDSLLVNTKKNTQWIDRDVIFPLREIMFEGHSFMSPNKPSDYIEYEYKNYMEFPNDLGEETHGYWKEYKERLHTVEFYLVDSFEISHFAVWYQMLRDSGVYAIFVAEPHEIHTCGGWFDYDKAIELLLAGEYEFTTKHNPNAYCAITTQDANVLRNYSENTIRINMTYGCSLNRNCYWFQKRAALGFDYKFVHGIWMKDHCKMYLDESHIKVMGYPRYINMGDNEMDRLTILDELQIDTTKPILCYYPTWDEDSSIFMFYEQLDKIKEKYYIVVKPHHCTWRLDEKKADKNKLMEIADRILPVNYDFVKSTYIGEVNVCDAKSGAALELSFVNPNANVLYISVHDKEDDYYYEELYNMAVVVNKNGSILNAIDEVCFNDQYKIYRQQHINNFLADKTENDLKNIMHEILDLNE